MNSIITYERFRLSVGGLMLEDYNLLCSWKPIIWQFLYFIW
jgi:hypothetical protein